MENIYNTKIFNSVSFIIGFTSILIYCNNSRSIQVICTMNTATQPVPPEDVQGDNRWFSVVSDRLWL